MTSSQISFIYKKIYYSLINFYETIPQPYLPIFFKKILILYFWF